MTQDTIERPRIEPKADNRQEGVLQRLESLYAKRRESEFKQTIGKVASLRESFIAERDKLLPPDVRKSIKDSVGKSTGRENGGRRLRSLIELRGTTVDLDALGTLYRAYGDKFADIIREPFAFKYHDYLVDSLTDVLKIPPFLFPDPDKAQFYFPEYAGSWDRIEQHWATGDGAVDETTSWLDGGMARLGSRLRAHNHDARDADGFCVYREGGYLVPFKTLKTGILQVKADLSALFCQHRISTEDEWGWSDFHATTRGRLILAVFWKWEDVDPANEVSDNMFVGGLDVSGDGENSPGTVVTAVPGERRIIDLYTTMAFPPGQNLWIYVGLSDKIWCFLNDVSIDMSVDSAWRLNSLAVRSL